MVTFPNKQYMDRYIQEQASLRVPVEKARLEQELEDSQKKINEINERDEAFIDYMLGR